MQLDVRTSSTRRLSACLPACPPARCMVGSPVEIALSRAVICLRLKLSCDRNYMTRYNVTFITDKNKLVNKTLQVNFAECR